MQEEQQQGGMLTRLEEDGEPKIDGLKGEVVVLVSEQEVLGLEVPVHDPERVAGLDDPDDDPGELRGLALAVVPSLYDAVEELSPRAELHDDVHVELVLVGALDGDHAGVAGEVVHDLDLAPHVVHVLGREQLALGDGLAGVGRARGEVGGEVGGAELALAELAAQGVEVAEGRRVVAQHRRGRGELVLVAAPAAHDGVPVRRALDDGEFVGAAAGAVTRVGGKISDGGGRIIGCGAAAGVAHASSSSMAAGHGHGHGCS